jgi:hypothetical protein
LDAENLREAESEVRKTLRVLQKLFRSNIEVVPVALVKTPREEDLLVLYTARGVK